MENVFTFSQSKCVLAATYTFHEPTLPWHVLDQITTETTVFPQNACVRPFTNIQIHRHSKQHHIYLTLDDDMFIESQKSHPYGTKLHDHAESQ